MPLHTVSFLVENKPGVLFKVSNLFRRRGYNITSLTVGPVEGSPLSRMTVVVDAESRVLNQIIEQLDKMVDVVKVKRLDPIRTLSRELLLIKLKTSDPMARIEAVNTVNAYHGLILDVEPDILIAEVTGPTDEIDEFLRKIGPIGIEEMSRTGAA
ncbi:MAG: acetolactate synthase small subunit, partial [Candidatus Bathyarchaeota archaeon]|nr:acetolactate synthase small subunit [Candidatus Bathyarchaeota archaeon]